MTTAAKKKSNRRYRQTPGGKASQARSNDKSAGKRFIKRYARPDELDEYEALIQARRQALASGKD